MVRQFCRELIADADTVSRVGMVSHELLENLVKYSSGGLCEIRVEVRREGDCQVVRIATENEAEPDRLEEVHRRLVEIQEASDPVAFYDRTIKASARRREGSGLGLARIVAEGEMEVSHRIARGRLTICVRGSATSEAS